MVGVVGALGVAATSDGLALGGATGLDSLVGEASKVGEAGGSSVGLGVGTTVGTAVDVNGIAGKYDAAIAARRTPPPMASFRRPERHLSSIALPKNPISTAISMST